MRSARALLPALTSVVVVIACVAVGLALTHGGVSTWDSYYHLLQSRWLVAHYGIGANAPAIPEHLKWYGPLWELFLGVMTEGVFPFLRDPIWIRQGFTFGLALSTLYFTYRFLVRSGVAASTALLACAFLVGVIRLGGHAFLNVKDLPFSCVFLLVTLGLWRLLPRLVSDRFHPASAALVGVVSVLPYLMRPPVLTHAVVVLAILVCQLNRRTCGVVFKKMLVVAGSGLVFIWAVWPAIWEKGWKGWEYWLKSFAAFSHFQWTGNVRLFGVTYASTVLPAWYPLAWIPIAFHPLVLLGVVAGLIAFLVRKPVHVPILEVQTFWGRVRLTLRAWLGLFVVVSFAGVFLIRPVLYDEERHLLFLFPPLVVFAALNLNFLSKRFKAICTVMILAAASASYLTWGRYAYVYKSPLIPDRRASSFMGDYWGICVPKAMQALPEHASPGSEVVVLDTDGIRILEAERLSTSRFWRLPGFGPYEFRNAPSKSKPYFVIVYNRDGFNVPVLRDVQEGRAELLWQDPMPPDGEPACVLVRYPLTLSGLSKD